MIWSNVPSGSATGIPIISLISTRHRTCKANTTNLSRWILPNNPFYGKSQNLNLTKTEHNFQSRHRGFWRGWYGNQIWDLASNIRIWYPVTVPWSDIADEHSAGSEYLVFILATDYTKYRKEHWLYIASLGRNSLIVSWMKAFAIWQNFDWTLFCRDKVTILSHNSLGPDSI